MFLFHYTNTKSSFKITHYQKSFRIPDQDRGEKSAYFLDKSLNQEISPR